MNYKGIFLFVIISFAFSGCASIQSNFIVDKEDGNLIELSGNWVRQLQLESSTTIHTTEFQFTGDAWLLRENGKDIGAGTFKIIHGSKAIELDIHYYLDKKNEWSKTRSDTMLFYSMENGELHLQGIWGLGALSQVLAGTYTNISPTRYVVRKSLTVSWTSFNFLHIPQNENKLKEKAMSLLREEAEKQGLTGGLDIKIISIEQKPSPYSALLLTLVAYADIRTTVASAAVISNDDVYNEPSTTIRRIASGNSAAGIDGAINRAVGKLINELPHGSIIAIISFSANDNETAAFIIEETEYLMVDSRKFTMVDRSTLDKIRSEQNFQMSGDVSDSSAVSLGQMLGANTVITGSITGTGSNQRLSFKALDVRTAQILTIAREEI